ncbi:hypothetical protein ElyMa_002178000 [Elysia marginata]|uniref:Uncharacterized protein n=1 Tax=Elysia marginata TaxID=1093978 RepID=A0AAV4FS09_9GAST|nr:hypothetical protein ElyMa_002178000 [Elysia marginata]
MLISCAAYYAIIAKYLNILCGPTRFVSDFGLIVVVVVVVVVVVIRVEVVVVVIVLVEGETKKNYSRHECAIFTSREHEAAESFWGYENCEKNPGHENFISVQDFKDNYLPRLQSDEQRERFRSRIDRTVRLRVNCTSRTRPDDDDMAEYRGTSMIRV